MKRNLLLGWISLFGVLAFAQEDSVVMRINGKEIPRSEFECSYRRHTDGNGTKLSPREYAELFILSKLKVEAARAAGLDTTSAFRKQQQAYRTNLLRSYLLDDQEMDGNARILYQKMKENVRGGQVQIQQIYKYLPQTITSRHLQEEQARMDSIYQVIQNQPGVDFARLVDRFSDDKRCRWIESLQTTSEFEEAAFSLAKGEISKPFFTPEGIHILKVIDRKEVPAYEVVSDSLLNRLRRQPLDKGTEAIVEQLKKEYQYIPNMESLEEVLQKGGTERALFTINGQAYTGEMFKRFASSHPQAVKRQLNGFIAKSLLDYESQHMERKHPELRYTLQEYAEKCLAEEIVHQKVDLPAVNDRAGLATYFKFHSSDYRWEHPRYKGVVLHCADKKTAKQAKKLLKKVPENEWEDMLRKTFNTSGAETIKIEQGVFADGDNKYIDKLVFKKGTFDPVVSYPFTIAVGKKQKGPEDYREVIDQVRKDYRSYLNAYWEQELRESGKVEINQEVLKTVNNN